MTNNAFGRSIPSLNEILANTNVNLFVRASLENVLGQMGITDREMLIPEVVKLAQSQQKKKYEKEAHKLLAKASAKIKESLEARSSIVAGHVSPYLFGEPYLDVGCGDGSVAALIGKNGRSIYACDVYTNPNIARMGIPFEEVKEGRPLPYFSNSFDTTLALMMLHHSDSPEYALKEITRVTRHHGRIIIIESVFGIPKETIEEFNLSQSAKEMTEAFKGLTFDEQFMANCFFDHFYNRVIHSPDHNINVPCNFNTPLGWKTQYKALNLRPINHTAFGMDMELVPEYHTRDILLKP